MIQAGAVVLDKHHIAGHEVRLRLQLLQLPGLLLQEYRVLRQRRLRSFVLLLKGLQLLLGLVQRLLLELWPVDAEDHQNDHREAERLQKQDTAEQPEGQPALPWRFFHGGHSPLR